MHYKKMILIFIAICIPFFCFPAQTGSLISRCRSALEQDITPGNLKNYLSLSKQIKDQENLYLKSGLYPDVRRCYGKLQAKLGKYYFNGKDYEKALECYLEADNYYDWGYSKEIAECKKKLPAKKAMTTPPTKPQIQNRQIIPGKPPVKTTPAEIQPLPPNEKQKPPHQEEELASVRGPIAAGIKRIYKNQKGSLEAVFDYGIVMVYVPAGIFPMGAKRREPDESPVHKVHTNSFWIGKHEVTQGLWKAVMEENPALFNKGDNYPVEAVDWNDAQVFILKLNDLTGLSFRLPTEAEWEKACRAGKKYGQYVTLGSVAWYNGNSNEETHPVGLKKPNAFGIYDMLGNVCEWCQDWYDKNFYHSSGYFFPKGPSTGFLRVYRGGSWYDKSGDVRFSKRYSGEPSLKLSNLGFRLAHD
jgi:formylglycine-generating enzyme required for sulfatase activity